jgi:hypothetical protein
VKGLGYLSRRYTFRLCIEEEMLLPKLIVGGLSLKKGVNEVGLTILMKPI